MRDFFYLIDNYVHDLDVAAERLVAELSLPDREAGTAIPAYLERRHGVRIMRTGPGENILRRYDPAARVLFLNPYRPWRRAFQSAFPPDRA